MSHPDAAGQYVAAVRAAATSFRTALEQGGLRLISLAQFPHGSCGDTCELLGQFLFDSGLGQWIYCSGQRDEPFQTHAWLERDGLILDITADQFGDIHEPVLLTRDHGWHAKYSRIPDRWPPYCQPRLVSRTGPCGRCPVDVRRVATTGYSRCATHNVRSYLSPATLGPTCARPRTDS